VITTYHHHTGEPLMAKTFVSKRGRLAACILAMLEACALCGLSRAGDLIPVRVQDREKLAYSQDDRGNQIPDFSHCGYAGADTNIPTVPVRIVVKPAAGDDGPRIQAAIDAVARLPLGNDGFRGAVLLAPGQFEVRGQLRISNSGVALRGSGAGDNGTTLLASGRDRRALLRIEGIANRNPRGKTQYHVVDDYVPVGANKMRLDSVAGLRVGDKVMVTRPSTREWIKTIGMDAFGVVWQPGTRDIRSDRTITRIENDTITLDAPLCTALEKQFGGATIEPYDWPGRIEHIGVDDLRIQSEYESANSQDEEHAWFGITMQNVENSWVRRIEFRHFAGGAVALWENTKWITVQDCLSLEPISENAGYRRHTFFVQGQLALFLRCWSEHGRHDFSVGHCAAGPNAFVHCYAADALGDSGPIESWASGVLYDNVRINGAGLNLENRWINPPGCGWSAANCVLWNCQAATMRIFRPPTANNWAIGVWAGCIGDGTISGRSDFVRPMSLYQAQLAARRSPDVAADVGEGLIDPIGSTNPTLAEAAKFIAQSKQPQLRLIDVIREIFEKAKARAESSAAGIPAESKSAIANSPTPSPKENGKLAVKNGWLVIDGRLKTGSLIQQPFWRGTIRPDEVRTYGRALTRFVPGRVGPGFTDDLGALSDEMVSKKIAVFDHHYGLWYDRRRDEHTMVRQANGDVAPPFLEQPFARIGTGSTWNELTEYDLTKFNPWYWRRLRDFAQLCDERGLVLIHQNYFQHNILEAGAHWADCPWRPANNVNDMGLPEPPPYIGDKRIFMAQQFYDVSDPRRRALHRGYIRQCLDNFAGCSNVIQMTSAEYSGPLEFTQFWLDTIIEWEREHSHRVLVGLSAPKNVQDAILADPKRAPYVDVIDIRYWAYTADDGIYAPEGGRNLSPRQHVRQTKLRPGGFASIVKAVCEYRKRFPDKVVTYYADMNCPSGRDGWAVLMGGGSLPNVTLPNEFAKVVPTLMPAEGIVSNSGQWCLSNTNGDYIVYTVATDREIEVNVPAGPTGYRVRWIDSNSGEIQSDEIIAAARPMRQRSKTNVLWLERVNSN
jgi:hypothetical protein